MRSDLSEHYCCVQKGMELYEHINYFSIAQIYKLFLGISYVFLMSYVHCEEALKNRAKCLKKQSVLNGPI
jgi:hypothetical protein